MVRIIIVLSLLLNLLLTIPAIAQQGGKSSTPMTMSSQPPVSESAEPHLPANQALPVKLSSEEIYQLQKLQMQQQLQNELLAWAQTRFWIIAIVSVVVGFFGVRALVREMLANELRDATRASADAQAAAGQGREAVREVRNEAAKYRDMVQDLATAANEADKQLEELRSRIDAEASRTVAASDLKIVALNEQVAEINAMVNRLAQKHHDTEELARDSEKRIQQVRETAETKQAAFAENSLFRVIVIHHGRGSTTESIANDLITALSKEGFKASEGVWTPRSQVHDRVNINYYSDEAEDKASLVYAIVQETLASQKYPAEVALSESQRLSREPLEDSRVFRIFF